jgi:hypothetical protein
MTPAAFRKLALAFDGASEGTPGGHPDFRGCGATNLKLTPADSRTARSALAMALKNMEKKRKS